MPDQNVPSQQGGFYSPFFQNFQKEMAQMLDHFRGTSPTSSAADFFQGGKMLVPAIDVAETEAGLEISADIPGVSKDDIDVTLQGDTLVIKGEKSTAKEEKDKAYHIVERRHGSFRRHIPLGFVPEEGAVDASFADGVLKLTIPRPADAPSGVQKVEIRKS